MRTVATWSASCRVFSQTSQPNLASICFEGHVKKEKSLTILEPFRRSCSRDTPNMEGAVLVHAAWGSPFGEPTFDVKGSRMF